LRGSVFGDYTPNHPIRACCPVPSTPALTANLSDLTSRLICATIGSCSCSTKSSDVKAHLPTCRYRVLSEVLPVLERAKEWDQLFQAFVLESAFPGSPGQGALWPNPRWSQGVALLALALHEGLRAQCNGGSLSASPPASEP
jgi:hypothetical protein